MGCNCGKKSGTQQWVYTSSTGKTTTYNTEIEARAAVVRNGGGTVKAK